MKTPSPVAWIATSVEVRGWARVGWRSSASSNGKRCPVGGRRIGQALPFRRRVAYRAKGSRPSVQASMVFSRRIQPGIRNASTRCHKTVITSPTIDSVRMSCATAMPVRLRRGTRHSPRRTRSRGLALRAEHVGMRRNASATVHLAVVDRIEPDRIAVAHHASMLCRVQCDFRRAMPSFRPQPASAAACRSPERCTRPPRRRIGPQERRSSRTARR
jgi:hypothetical protein